MATLHLDCDSLARVLASRLEIAEDVDCRVDSGELVVELEGLRLSRLPRVTLELELHGGLDVTTRLLELEVGVRRAGRLPAALVETVLSAILKLGVQGILARRVLPDAVRIDGRQVSVAVDDLPVGGGSRLADLVHVSDVQVPGELQAAGDRAAATAAFTVLGSRPA